MGLWADPKSPYCVPTEAHPAQDYEQDPRARGRVSSRGFSKPFLVNVLTLLMPWNVPRTPPPLTCKSLLPKLVTGWTWSCQIAEGTHWNRARLASRRCSCIQPVSLRDIFLPCKKFQEQNKTKILVPRHEETSVCGCT